MRPSFCSCRLRDNPNSRDLSNCDSPIERGIQIDVREYTESQPSIMFDENKTKEVSQYRTSSNIIKGEKMMKLKIVLEPSEDGGFTVTVPSLPGCISEGSTRQEALENIKEAVLLYLEPVADDLNYPPDSEIVEISL